MGACILCGKSAGLFYSLHKNCYQLYQSSLAPIINTLDSCVSIEPATDLAQQLHAHVEQFEFTAEAKQRILVRALEAFSKQAFSQEITMRRSSSAWVSLLEILDLDDALFIDPHFLDQQRVLPAIALLQGGELPESNCDVEQFPAKLRAKEEVWWCFEDASFTELQPPQNKRQWSVAMQVLEGILPRKEKVSLQKMELGRGSLWLTTQRICFEFDGQTNSIEYRDIMAITPEVDGVTLQLSERQALSEALRCKHGRLLYQFLQYAKGNNA